MEWVDKPQNYKELYGILELLRGSHLNNFPLKTLKVPVRSNFPKFMFVDFSKVYVAVTYQAKPFFNPST